MKVQWFKVHSKGRSRLSLTHLPVQPLNRVRTFKASEIVEIGELDPYIAWPLHRPGLYLPHRTAMAPIPKTRTHMYEYGITFLNEQC